ncbi:MAG: YihY/virulence factor BrkB family protein [Acidobacteriaceae bacterium]
MKTPRSGQAPRPEGKATGGNLRRRSMKWAARCGLWMDTRLPGSLRRTLLAALEHDVLTVAQAAAYSAMVALFPALIVAAAIFSLAPDTMPVREQMAQVFSQVLPSNVLPVLEQYFAPTHRNMHTARVLFGSVVVSVTGASSVMATLMEGFRRAYDLPLTRHSFWPRRIRSLALVPISLLPLAAVSILVIFGHLISRWLVGEVTPALRWPALMATFVLRWTIAFAGSMGIIAVIYHLGTDVTQQMRKHLEPLLREPWVILRKDWSWRASLPGAALATAAWLFTTLLFGVYVTRFADYSRVYGSLGVAIALLFWLYIIALSVLMGAEFNAQLSAQAPGRRDPRLSALLRRLPGLLRRHTGRMLKE